MLTHQPPSVPCEGIICLLWMCAGDRISVVPDRNGLIFNVCEGSRIFMEHEKLVKYEYRSRLGGKTLQLIQKILDNSRNTSEGFIPDTIVFCGVIYR